MVWVTLLLGLLFVVPTIVWLLLMMRMFALRHEFEILARSPPLVLTSHAFLLVLTWVVFAQWLLQSMGKSMPCYMVFVVTYAAQAWVVMPYVIRVVRLVVAYNKTYRAKYGRFVKWNLLRAIWVLVAIGCLIRGVTFYGKRPEHYLSARDCYYHDDTDFVAVLGLVTGPPLLFFARSLLKVKDSFKIGEELTRTIAGCVLIAGTNNVIITLVQLEVVADTPGKHLVVEVLCVVFGIWAAYHGFFVPMVRTRHLSHGSWLKFVVVPIGDRNSVTMASEAYSVLDLATKGGEMAEEFGRFCREHLCLESWDFIVDVVRYETTGTSQTRDEQFKAFAAIIDQYLLPTSPDEVNVSCNMRKRVSAFRTRDAFDELDAYTRGSMLHESLHEIVVMLEQNLLEKFHHHMGIRQEEMLRTAACGDNDLLQVMKASAKEEQAAKRRELTRIESGTEG